MEVMILVDSNMIDPGDLLMVNLCSHNETLFLKAASCHRIMSRERGLSGRETTSHRHTMQPAGCDSFTIRRFRGT